MEGSIAQRVEDRLTKLENRFVLFENRLLTLTTVPAKKNSLQYQVAHGVSSVVGLKEAITWKSNFLKCIWTLAVCVGVTATAYFVFASWNEYMSNPTATRIEVVAKPTYEYPPVLLCPNLWLDARKALSMDLTLEGLKYSLGYVNLFRDKIGPDDNAVGRRDFFHFFDKNNYSSLDDFWTEISVDVPVEPSIDKYDNNFYSSAYCQRCNVSILPKVVNAQGVCYKFEMQPENGTGRQSSVSRLIGLQLLNQSLGLITTSLWSLYVDAANHLNLKTPIARSVVMQEFTFVSVRFQERRAYYLQSKLDTPCLLASSVTNNYSATLCIEKCLTPLYTRALGCTPFENTVGKFENHPRELCNTYNNATWSKFQEAADSEKELVLASDEAKQCYTDCPYPCKRTRYETMFDGEFSSLAHSASSAERVDKARLLNTKFVDVYIENEALYQGGVTTYWEISTISFIELISNVGGTLGLFVGCTMMTFVQIVLFIIKFLTEKQC